MKKIVSIACVAMLGSGLAQAGGQSTEAGQSTRAGEGSAPAAAATTPAAIAATKAATSGHGRLGLYVPSHFPANAPLRAFGKYLLAQNDDTARFATVPEVYTATQARIGATVGVRSERKL